ncbi:ThiF family adenylyltransferase [Staphylospora marina]|uniref:ThiF family adenylyltransferase n=1 Tax=Staphylospora marina TaxID=2490858 RepID=UPI000F5BCFC9|nr:ThiF family adenylyltransferase [Staphylospora marina]
MSSLDSSREYIRFRPGVFPSFPASGQIELRTGPLGPPLIRLLLPEGEDWVSPIFRRLDGSRPIPELLDAIPESRRADARKLLSVLVAKRWAETGDAPFKAEDPVKDHLLAFRSFSNEDAERTLRKTRLLVLGAGRLGSRIAGNLTMTGFRQLTLLDPSPVSFQDRTASPLLLQAEPGTPRANALASALREMAPDAAVQAVTEADGRTLEREMAEHDLTIVAEDCFHPRLLSDVNRLAVRLGKRWSMVLVNGWNLHVGPTIFPGQSGCLLCLHLETGETWVPENAPEEPAADSGEPTRSLESGFPSLVWPPHADVAAGLLATDMLHAAGIMPRRIEPGTGMTLGRQLVFDLKSGQAFWRTVPRRPDCPVCGPGALSHPHEY